MSRGACTANVTNGANEAESDNAKRRKLNAGVPCIAEDEAFTSLCINTIRCLGADMPQIAKSGHPGAPLGCAPIAHALWGYVMNYSPRDINWINRDRFILSNGHGCALQYAILHLTGYDLSLEDLKRFRQLHSKTPGHPECFATPGVEVCTGPLGQGISNAVGMAIASHHLASKYNKRDITLFDNYVYCLCGDGCLQEGVSSEACSLAGHLGLGRLIVLYDDNGITIDGRTDLSFTEDVSMRYKAYGWEVMELMDGNSDSASIVEAIRKAQQQLDKPTLIRVKTTIGFGSVNEGTEKVHGSPLGIDDVKQLKTKFGFDPSVSFHIPPDVLKWYRSKGELGDTRASQWQAVLKRYKQQYPIDGQELERRMNGELPLALLNDLPRYAPTDKAQAGRAFSGIVLNILSDKMPELIGGSADLSTSNATVLRGEGNFDRSNHSCRYIRYGVREHAMAAISNGLALYGGFRVFCATFLNFLTYGWGAVRLSALSEANVLYIATHDSIEMGEDGPTHQAIETLALIRATPNIVAIRPADGNEVSGAYAVWAESVNRPVVLALCRGAVPNLEGTSVEKVKKGAYCLSPFANSDFPKVLIGSSGSELYLCMEAKVILTERGFDVCVVSIPSWDLLEEQGADYKKFLLMTEERRLGSVKTVYVEASYPIGWDKYFDIHIGMTTFGASAPKEAVWKHFGFTAEHIVETVENTMA